MIINQFIRFAGIGFLNTAVDFAVLNLFASTFQSYVGIRIGAINAISFSIAVLHSYFWNKSWVFGEEEGVFFRNLVKFVGATFLGVIILAAVVFGSGQQFGPGYFLAMLLVLLVGELVLWKAYGLRIPSLFGTQKELGLFVAISLIGIFINSGIVAGGTKLIPPQFGTNQELWTNLIKAAATGISLIWNFLGYKLVVFRR